VYKRQRLSFTEGAEDSLIVASNDGGRAWKTQYRVRSDWRRGYAQLCGVDFPDSDHGWAVGNRYFDNTAIPAPAVVFSTADGGRKWRSSEFGVGMDLWAVDAIDATHVWAVGRSIAETEAAALVTTDGATWVKRKLGVKGLLYQVQFVDPLHGWAAGITPPTSTSGTPQQPVSFVLATTDGGTTWVRQRIEDNRQLRVEFVDALHGWAYDGDGRMWVTETGGFAPPPRSSAPSSSPAVSGCSSRRVVGGSPR
jgi:photosystem II stability/assembly factor-like uncharacterized protein